MASFDVIVVGAGIAGSMTAALLGQQGFHVLLLERAVFPRPKICGEGLMPAGAKIFERLGILGELAHAGGKSFSGIRFHLPGDLSLELDFNEISQGTLGWVLPRISLDARLATFAAQQPGVQLCQAFQVQSACGDARQVQVTGLHQGMPQTHRAKLLIGADGIRSRFHDGFGIHRRKKQSFRFALRTLYDNLQGAHDMVEVHCCQTGEAYVAPMADGSARITLLLFGPVNRCRKVELPDYYFQNLQCFPRLIERLKAPCPQRAVESTGPVSLQVSRCHAQRLLLVGDAAGAVDPITGQGMTVALKDAETVSAFLQRQLREDRLSEKDLSEYTTRRQSYFTPAFQLAHMVLFMVQHPFIARRAIRALSRNQALRKKVVAMASQVRGENSLGAKDKFYFLLGI
ncbi:FAD-dependent monooxygenase [Acidobacteria bacterium AH-259-D05]|nr:FAD-dependent monooxygenase [Acidobacteria bacterium AH-259-D05]